MVGRTLSHGDAAMIPVNTKTLGSELPIEMARVRDEVLPMYLSIGPNGLFAATLMRAALDNAAKAMVEGDVIAMISAYHELKGFTT